MACTLETFKRIYNDDTGDYIQYGEDRDGLGLREITYGPENPAKNRITLTVEEAKLLVKAIQEMDGE